MLLAGNEVEYRSLKTNSNRVQNRMHHPNAASAGWHAIHPESAYRVRER
jgi:hypothetical protein